ncbi:MAG TPA: cation-translocating P-type ATPase [Syntrophorhabdaceae bacterium]|jgi:Ca2+-transporting ATPase
MSNGVSYAQSVEEVLKAFETDLDKGLSDAEVKARIAKYGKNELQEKEKPSFFTLLMRQFANFLVIILIIAAVVSLALGEWIDAVAILVIVILNAVVGVVQESKAEEALAALKKMSAPNAQVIRNGHQVSIPSAELVPGDIIMLEAGNYVPADMRLVETVNLKVEEASLTGESVPVEKEARALLVEDIPLGDRTNSAFMSTLISYGRGKGIVTGTGMNTEIGRIAEMLQSYEEEATPLQIKLDELAKWLGIICLVICGFIFVYGLVRFTTLSDIFSKGFMAYLIAEKATIVELFMSAVSLAIAAVPEGLPAVVTICLAIGMQRMIRRHALIRKLPAVETLGCATVICTDKTGTLTQNEMTVVQGWADGKLFHLSGQGYNPSGDFSLNGGALKAEADVSICALLYGGLLCSDAKLEQFNEDGAQGWRIVGDPTEGALVVAAAKAGLWREATEKAMPRVMEIPFDSDRKRMTTVHEWKNGAGKSPVFGDNNILAFVKGAPDIILNLSDTIVSGGEAVPLTEEMKKNILSANHDMATQALRVLAIACRSMPEVPQGQGFETVETGLTFVGLMAMIDPARPEAQAAVAVARKAGLRTVMVTGDHKDTAVAIAGKIGLLTPDGIVLTGEELDRMSDEELTSKIDRLNACCRVSPQHKTRIVDAFKAKGHVAAMTGDGVNDAPALKRANIGVAMGITGTDVSKQTADMVLTDDNFASIVSAIAEGRVIYSNIRKFVFYLISCNIGEILIIFLAMLFGMPMPLKPVQLLILNLVTDGAPALALGLEKGEPDLMDQPPRSTKEPVINGEMAFSAGVQAVVMTALVLGVFAIALGRYPGNSAYAETIAFTTLCMSELVRAFTARSQYHSVFSIGVFSNKSMNWATMGSAVLVLFIVYVPFLQPIFDTVSLGVNDWLLMIPFIFGNAIAAELTKIYLRHRMAKRKVVLAAN